MTSALASTQTVAIRSVFAALTNCQAGDFDRGELTITTRAEPPLWPFAAMVVGFGAGTVACVEERFAAWAREHAPASHQRASYLVISLAAEGTRRGDTLEPQPPMLGWALGERRTAASLPARYRVERVSREWMNEWQPRNVFTNAVGSADQGHRTFRNQFAYVAFDADDAPAAVAGVFDTAGLSEIGVDVVPAHRGQHLAAAVVTAASGAILDDGGTPFYVCEVTNVRSQRTALASGYVPVCSLALVMPAGM